MKNPNLKFLKVISVAILVAILLILSEFRSVNAQSQPNTRNQAVRFTKILNFNPPPGTPDTNNGTGDR